MNTLNYHSTENGFTLMELMIVIAIISILSSVAIPAYHGYIQKAALTDVLQTLSPYRSAVELCHYEHQYNQCHADASFMPQQFRSRYLTDIHVVNGVISAKGKAQLEGLTIVMTPAANSKETLPHWQINCTSTNTALQKLCHKVFKSH
ncbi:TPA: prepilin peptidase-dependent pilin [Proteus mirabilis]